MRGAGKCIRRWPIHMLENALAEKPLGPPIYSNTTELTCGINQV